MECTNIITITESGGTGFEPASHGATDRHSIQLSYPRTRLVFKVAVGLEPILKNLK
jgi:hypothetical protein